MSGANPGVQNNPIANVGGIVAGEIMQATVKLSAAQIAALATTPIEMAPAPGPGKTIVPIAGTVSLHFKTTPYGTGTASINVGSTPINSNGQLLNALFATASAVISATFQSSAINNSLATINAPLSIGAISPVTGGDSSATVTVDYTINPV